MKLVLVEWLDSHSGHPGWRELDGIKQANGPVRCRSVGWLVSESKQHKTIVPHLSGEDGGVVPFGRGDLTIPCRAITRMRVLVA